MTHGSLFSGIGGFDLAAEWIGWENMFHCEINEFCNKVLNYYWPNAKSYKDIKKTDFTKWRGKIDVLTGGFPCQPNSRAGKQNFQEDERFLWPEMFRAFREIQPTWGVPENVLGIIDSEYTIRKIESDLASIGYDLLPIQIPANAVGANHKRERIWFVAHSSNIRRKGGVERKQAAHEQRFNEKDLLTRELQRSEWGNGLPRPQIFRNDDGVSKKLVIESIRAFGNAIVPKVAYEIFKAISSIELQNVQVSDTTEAEKRTEP
jgi:DNA (cytosine-5)-methyltransferase 1